MVSLTDLLITFCNKITNCFNNTMTEDSMVDFYSLKTLTGSVTDGSNWTVNSYAVHLQGNLITLHLDATRSSASSTGAITNETIASFSINNTYGLSNFYTTSSISSTYGNVSSYFITNTSISESKLDFDLQLTATHAGVTHISCNFCMLARFDKEKLLAQL